MDAAERIFLDKGVAAKSVDDIVAAADVAKGTFYIHFESKEHLLLSLQKRFVATFCSALLAATNRRGAGDWRGRLQAWLAASVDFYFDRSAVHRLVFHECRPERPHAKDDNPIVDQLACLLEQGAKAGVWSVDAPHLTAVLLFHALHGAVHDAIDGATLGTTVNRKRLARGLTTFFHRAVGLA